MGQIRHKHYVVRKGRGFWLATPAMQAHGFCSSVPCGADGPTAWAIADEWESRWQAARSGETPGVKKTWPKGSLGAAFDEFRRSDTWAAKKPRTREEWEQRGWPRIAPIFGDVAPRTVTFQHVDKWYHSLKASAGVREAHRAMKIWRALWQVAAAMQYCDASKDPSAGVRRETPKPRSATWREGEIVRLVKASWRAGYHGLACIEAIAWDTGFSPGDVRTLTLAQSRTDGRTIWFEVGRAKTGQPAIGTLSRRSEALLKAYLATIDASLLPTAPIFRTRGAPTGPKGGRPRASAPYRKESLVSDFAAVRSLVFGPKERRRLSDMRRSGAVEAMRGNVSDGALSAKMANTLSDSKELQRTYLPVDRTAVTMADDARRVGRRRIRENESAQKVETLRPGELKLATAIGAK
jgi:integrase